MLWSYVQLDDGTQFAYSETREDGTVRVAVERPVDLGIDHAECFLPAVNSTSAKPIYLARLPEASKRPIAILTCA